MSGVEHRIAHIREEVATREKYGLVGNGQDVPSTLCVSWCEVDASGQWFFLHSEHALLHLKRSGSIVPCPDCLRALRAVIDAEIGP